MPDTALLTITHFQWWSFLWLMLVAEIKPVWILRFGKFPHNVLFFLCCFFHPFIELITRSMPYIDLFPFENFCLFWRKYPALLCWTRIFGIWLWTGIKCPARLRLRCDDKEWKQREGNWACQIHMLLNGSLLSLLFPHWSLWVVITSINTPCG